MDWLCELDQRQGSFRKHIRLSNSNGVIFTVFLKAVHQFLELDVMLFLKKRHQVSHNFDKDWLLLLQDVDPWILAQLQGIDKTCILDISHSVKCLNFETSLYSSPHGFLFLMILHHGVIDSSCSCSLSELNVRHHQMLLVGVPEHVLKIFLKLAPKKETSSDFLDLDYLLPSLIEVNLDVVSRSVASI